MKVVIIAAVAENGVIGREGKLPWHIPEDLKHFRSLTLNHPVIMGRKTHESVGKLDNRDNIVITSKLAYSSAGVIAVNSLHDALKECSGETVFIIGGESVFKEALPLAGRLEITKVHRAVEGDAYFPPVGEEWEEIRRENHEWFSFLTYRRMSF